MAHALVEQLRFTRGELRRGLSGVTEKDAAEHCGQMNSIGWIVGHLAWQEQRVLLHRPQGIMLLPDIQDLFAFRAPMSLLSLAEMLKAWRKVTRAADSYVDSLTTKALLRDLPLNGRPSGQSQGSAIRRLIYHYWFHIGEIQAVRQIVGHNRLPVYVGNIEAKAPYRAEK